VDITLTDSELTNSEEAGEIPALPRLPVPVGILGATGAVGQRFIELLDGHPWFAVTDLTASDRSAGKTYRDAANWQGSKAIPDAASALTVKPTEPDLDCRIVFSSLPSAEAVEVERRFAEAGYVVISNSSAYRMGTAVPLLIPEVNPAHLDLVRKQPTFDQGGFIVTNPNCSTVGLVSALKPLHDAFGLETIHVTTMQALSGAGYPGVPSLDAVANVVPFIGGEEEKIESEPLKLLGTLDDGAIRKADFKVSAQCNRVPVVDGHLLTVSAKLGTTASPQQVVEAFRSFRAPSEVRNLPSAPAEFIHVFEDDRSPQPRKHVDLGKGMTVSVGRVRSCPILDVRFVVLVHNTIRGAAGGAILNAELVLASGLLGAAG